MVHPDKYVVIRSRENGQRLYILRTLDRYQFGTHDPEYERFLEWNKQRTSPLNVEEFEFPADHVIFTEVQSLADYCRDHGITLWIRRWPNGGVNFESSGCITFPEKGPLYQLHEAAAGNDHTDDGIQPRPSKVWVDGDTLTKKMTAQVFDPESNLRRVSTWPITRTFVYLDISDFSKHPAGQEALIINSLVRIVNERELWLATARGLPDRIEARMCIGDGYIFVFKEAMEATYFAAYLAYLIEVLVANKKLPVSFHFRMGVHIGPVYTFWDPGRNGWNYIGDGINGGNRVLSAIDKGYDDMLYISGEVRQELMASSDRYTAFGRLLENLHNRGRRPDKHGRPWRVYEVSHAAVCQIDLPAKLNYCY